MLTISLLRLIDDNYKIISIIGMAKNSGKTVALNHLLQEAMDLDMPLGITSIGRDGESLDLVTETDKPRIYVEEGILVATTTGLLSLGDARVEIIKVTDYQTPLGEIIIGRIRESGYIQIAGPQSLKEIKEVAEIMLNLGAKFVILDGALDRRTSAAPSISQGAILSTGAILSPDMNKVIEKTLHTVNLFSLPTVGDNRAKGIIEDIIRNKEIAIIDDDYKIESLKMATALNAGHIIGSHLKPSSKYLVIPGSLVKNTIEGIINSTRNYRNIKIIVEDGTKIFIEPKDWLRFMKYGVKVKVLNPIDIIGITLNPYSPLGYYFDPHKFLEEMKLYIKDIPIMDLMLGGN